MINEKRWNHIFDMTRRLAESEISERHCNLAYAIQHVLEEIVLKIVIHTKEITGCENVCFAGGVALNCVSNGNIARSNIFKNIFVQPASNDSGGAIGAALAGYYIYYDQNRECDDNHNSMQGALLGPSYSNDQTETFLNEKEVEFTKFNSDEELCDFVANLIKEGSSIGWFQGRMEFGPRALGNRSIVANPMDIEMQRHLNLKIKFRESFRPFAPAILAEKAADYFEEPTDSPYMLFTSLIKKEYQTPLAEDYESLPVLKKVHVPRSVFPSITHIDFSSRLQTVSEESNYKFYKLIEAFYKVSGCPILINTSFNVRGEPIVCSLSDAYDCFERTNLDYLVLNNYIVRKF